MKKMLVRVSCGLVMALVCVGMSWAGVPSTWQERLAKSAGAKYTRALEAAARKDTHKARKLLGQLLWRLEGSAAGAAVRRRLAKLDKNAAFQYSLELDALLTHQVQDQRTRKRRKMRMIFSSKKVFARKFKMKAGGAMLVVELKMTPGKGLSLKGWVADKAKVKRFRWPAMKLRRGARQKRKIRMTLGAISAELSLTAAGVTKGAKAPLGSKPVAGRKGVRVVRRSKYRVIMRNASAKRVVTRLAEINGLTPVWAPGLTFIKRKLTLELKLSSKASSRIGVLKKMCRILGLRCQPKGKKVFVTKAPKRPKAPRPPAAPAVPKRAGGTPKPPKPPTPPRAP